MTNDKINYEQEVKKVYPNARIFLGYFSGRVYVERPIKIFRIEIWTIGLNEGAKGGWADIDTYNKSWESAYNNLKNQNKL